MLSKEDKIKKSKLILENYIADKDMQDFSPAYIAKNLKRLKKDNEDAFFTILKKIPTDKLGDIVIELPEHILKDVLAKIPTARLANAIEELESDDATDLIQDIEEIDSQKAKEVFESLDEKDQEEILKLKTYEENEAGAYMQAESFVGRKNEKIKNAIARLRRLKKEGELENIHQFFVTDKSQKLLFSVALEDLITFDFEQSFQEILKQGDKSAYKPITAYDNDDIDIVISLFEEHDLSVLPIINNAGQLVGRITSDDIHDLIQENATEQIYNLAGVDDEAEEEESSLMEAGKSRAMWLFVNLLTAIIASLVIGLFDETIQAYVALAVLMPIVASMGGNAGTQTLTVVVRKMALGEISFENAKEALQREVIISSINGLLFACVMGIIAYLWFHVPLLGVVIAASMLINLFFAGFFGASIPLGLKKLNIDPAIGSTVLLTTVTDVVGFFSFLGLAKWILL